jgi:nitroreductase
VVNLTNQVLEVIKTRSSIRAYKSKPLTEEQKMALQEAALSSPSAMNRQPYKFIFINNMAVLKEMEQDVINFFVAKNDEAVLERMKSRDNKVLYDAPCLIVIAIEDNNSYAKVDAGIAVQNIALSAKSTGLDSVIVGMPGVVFSGEKADYWRKRLDIPEGYAYGIAIAVGYADMEKAPHEHDKSKIHTID